MTYDRVLAFLDSRISLGWKLGLDSMRQMLAELGNPEKSLRFVHIAGTNGKGSVAAMLASVAHRAGYRTGLYTSPHLIDMRERIRLNGEIMSERQLAEVISFLKPVAEKFQATYFETLTAAALLFFARQKAQIVMLEVGLGGRLDATNVVSPEATVITSIALDHTEHLGGTLHEIAAEKAGIIKEGVPCVIGDLPEEAQKVIEQTCREHRAPLHCAQNLSVKIVQESAAMMHLALAGASPFAVPVRTPLVGRHQALNVAMVATVCEILTRAGRPISPESFQHGLCSANWPGRFEILQRHPTVVVDVAHNPAAMAELMVLINSHFSSWKKWIIIGLLKDKDSREICRQIAAVADVILPVEPQSPRALPAVELKRQFDSLQGIVREPATVSQGVEEALKAADSQTLICITGSHFVVGEALKKIKGLTK